MRKSRFALLLVVAFWAPALVAAVVATPEEAAAKPAVAPAPSGHDPHSFARPEAVAVAHLELDLSVDFASRRLSGRALLTLDRRSAADKLIVDTRDLEIRRVTLDDSPEAVPFELGEASPFLGRPLSIPLRPETRRVRIEYSTRPEAAALQWLSPEQTAGKKSPFLLTQSQAILARTWVPIQDSPGIRFTYEATVRVPPAYLAVMSAENPIAKSADGIYRFRMERPIPAYLLALAVGDLEFRPLGERSGVYAEPAVVPPAAWEFADTEKMITAAERLYGPYRWGRYDLLILPPSFPYGGMENPRLTFASSTSIAGDRSLVALVAHELAHSWSGNLVTNATWNDFWLNEGFTTYFENRIMEEVYGREQAEILAQLARHELEEELEALGRESPDTQLHLDLTGRDPDEGGTSIPYDKGMLFLRLLEQAFGRERWDAFLRRYFDTFAFRSMDSAGFLAYLRRELLAGQPELESRLRLDEWVYGPGLPANCPEVRAQALSRVEAEVRRFAGGEPAAHLTTPGWGTFEWLHFLQQLPPDLSTARVAELDGAFRFTTSRNAEVLQKWLLVAIAARYEPAYPALERFLLEVGRRRYVKPLYERLAATPEGLARARQIYPRARPLYHAVVRASIDPIVGWKEASATP